MKIRALLLIAIMIGGTYAMIQSFHDYDEKEFAILLDTMKTPFIKLSFTQPPTFGSVPETWNVDDETVIESLLDFLKEYHVRKLKPGEINRVDEINQFSINLSDENGNKISIIADKNLIIQNSIFYYEIVDGPLDMEWIVQFFLSNQI
jgi:hypothetical protein